MLDVARSMLDVMFGALATSCVPTSTALGVESVSSVCVLAVGSELLCVSCARDVFVEPDESRRILESMCYEGHECFYIAVYEHTMSWSAQRPMGCRDLLASESASKFMTEESDRTSNQSRTPIST